MAKIKITKPAALTAFVLLLVLLASTSEFYSETRRGPEVRGTPQVRDTTELRGGTNSTTQALKDLPAPERASLGAAMHEARYAVWRADGNAPAGKVAGDEVLHADNPAQQYRTEFEADAVRVSSTARGKAGEPSWTLALRLESYGSERQATSPAARRVAAGRRVEYHRGNVTEWYENTDDGLEQGFTIARPPAGMGTGIEHENQLEVRVAVDSNLTPRVDNAAGSRIGFYSSPGVRVVTYGKLKVTDANGKELPARMELISTSTLQLDNSANSVEQYARPTSTRSSTSTLQVDRSVDNSVEQYARRTYARRTHPRPTHPRPTHPRRTHLQETCHEIQRCSGEDRPLRPDGSVRFAFVDDAARGSSSSGESLRDVPDQLSLRRATAVVKRSDECRPGGDAVLAGAASRPRCGGSDAQSCSLDPADSRRFAVMEDHAQHQGQFGAIGEQSDGAARPSLAAGLVRSHYSPRERMAGQDRVREDEPGRGGAGGAPGSIRMAVDASGPGRTNSPGRPGDDGYVGVERSTSTLQADQKEVHRAYSSIRNDKNVEQYARPTRLSTSSLQLDHSVDDSVEQYARRTYAVEQYARPTFIIISVDTTGARYPITIDPLIGHETKVTAADGAANDRFGVSVALDGNTAVVGAHWADVGGNNAQGAAYVFTRSGTIWSQQAKLTAADGVVSDLFGYSVAVNGDTTIVGAHTAYVGANSYQGAAYVFTRSGTIWSEQAKLTAADGAAVNWFGESVSVSGDTAVVGAYGATVGAKVNQGAAYVFTRSGVIWSQQAKLTAADGAADDRFGEFVSVSGDTAIVAALFADGGNADQGAAYVFTRSGVIWSEQAKLTAGDGALNDEFGVSVSLSGDTAVVGAYGATVGANVYQGAAYVFTRSGVIWSQQAKLTAADGAANDNFGWSVSVSGDTAVVGAYLADVDGNADQGAAYVFTRSGVIWSQQAKLTAADGAASDQFGWSVAVSGDTAAVGMSRADVGANVDQGAAYFYIISPDTSVTASDGLGGDNFGNSVAINGDTAVVGTISADLAFVDQGAAYVFTRSGTIWSQQAKLTAGDGAVNDRFGQSVSISGDTAIVGAHEADVGGNTNQGAAYVFVRAGTIWSQQAKLTAADGLFSDRFGVSVALDGDTAVVGATNAGGQGAAYVFVRSGPIWTQEAKLIAGDRVTGDRFGVSVSVSGETAIVGAYNAFVGGNAYQGAAYVFVRSGTIWSQQAKLTAADGAANDEFGISVSVSGETAVVGAHWADVGGNFNQGAAYVFTRSGVIWSQEAKLTAADGAGDDELGKSVSLSGETTVVGANYADGAIINQGAAYVFTRSGVIWSRQAKLTAGDGAMSDQFGVSVAVDGDTAVVGADWADFGQGKAYFFYPLSGAQPGVTITETGTPTPSTDVSEDGATDNYTVVLDTQPTADVTITIAPDPQTFVSVASLTFTPGEWATPQTVTVTAVDDAVVEGDHTSTITHSATSADPNYDGAAVTISDVVAFITDNDVLPDDPYEENDSMAAAWDFSPGQGQWLSAYGGAMGIQWDDDWYLINVTAGNENVVIDLWFTHAAGDIDIELLDSAGGYVASSASTTNDNENINTMVAGPGAYFIHVFGGVGGIGGNAGNTYDLWWDDLPVDTMPPYVMSTNPFDGAIDVPLDTSIQVMFSEPMDMATTAPFITPPVAGSFFWNPTGDTLTFTPAPGLTSSTMYTVGIGAGATDLAGNPLTGSDSFSFTTSGGGPPPPPPGIVAVSPSPGAIDVPLDTTIQVTFSGDMSPTATEAAFSLEDAAGIVAGSLSWNVKTLVFTPAGHLIDETQYAVTIGTGATDSAGNPLLVQPYVFSFTTRGRVGGLYGQDGGCGCSLQQTDTPTLGNVFGAILSWLPLMLLLLLRNRQRRVVSNRC